MKRMNYEGQKNDKIIFFQFFLIDNQEEIKKSKKKDKKLAERIIKGCIFAARLREKQWLKGKREVL